MLETFGQIPQNDDIYLPAEPFQIRNNCQIGQFTQSDNLLGAKADFIICNFRQFYGDLGMTTDEYWNEIYAYPLTENLPPLVFQMFFKKAGRRIFNDLVNTLISKKINPIKGKFTCFFEKKQRALADGSVGNYYHLNWDWIALETLQQQQQDTFEKLVATVSGHVFPLPTDGNLILLPTDGDARNNAIASFKASKNQQLPQTNTKQLAANPF